MSSESNPNSSPIHAEDPDLGSRSTLFIGNSVFDRLSKREREVLELAVRGLIDKEIGSELGLATATVRIYWSRIRAKVGDLTRSKLASMLIADTRSPNKEVSSTWDLEIDLKRQVLRRFTPAGTIGRPGEEFPLAFWLRIVHPEDEAKTRSLFELGVSPGVSGFYFVNRYVTPQGMISGNIYGEVVRAEDGSPWKLMGRIVPSIESDIPPITEVQVGTGIFDLDSQQLVADLACQAILRINESGPIDLSAFYNRIHPRFRCLVVESLLESARVEGQETRVNFRLRYEDGTETWIAADLTSQSGTTRIAATIMAFQ